MGYGVVFVGGRGSWAMHLPSDDVHSRDDYFVHCACDLSCDNAPESYSVIFGDWPVSEERGQLFAKIHCVHCGKKINTHTLTHIDTYSKVETGFCMFGHLYVCLISFYVFGQLHVYFLCVWLSVCVWSSLCVFLCVWSSLYVFFCVFGHLCVFLYVRSSLHMFFCVFSHLCFFSTVKFHVGLHWWRM